MDKLAFSLSLDETNLVLAALAKLPFEAVSALIANITGQAQGQLQQPVEPLPTKAE